MSRTVVTQQGPRWQYLDQMEPKGDVVDKWTVRGSQVQRPLLEFSGACDGCAQTTYVKVMTQLFGNRMMIANATGCSPTHQRNRSRTHWLPHTLGRPFPVVVGLSGGSGKMCGRPSGTNERFLAPSGTLAPRTPWPKSLLPPPGIELSTCRSGFMYYDRWAI